MQLSRCRSFHLCSRYWGLSSPITCQHGLARRAAFARVCQPWPPARSRATTSASTLPSRCAFTISGRPLWQSARGRTPHPLTHWRRGSRAMPLLMASSSSGVGLVCPSLSGGIAAGFLRNSTDDSTTCRSLPGQPLHHPVHLWLLIRRHWRALPRQPLRGTLSPRERRGSPQGVSSLPTHSLTPWHVLADLAEIALNGRVMKSERVVGEAGIEPATSCV